MRVVGVQCILYKVLEGRDGDSSLGILLQKRNHKARIYPGYWACFGGTVEDTDTSELHTITRELEEELTATIMHHFSKVMTIPIYREESGLAMSFYSCEVLEVEGLKGNESLGYAFFNPEEVNHIVLRPEDRMAINEFLRQRGT